MMRLTENDGMIDMDKYVKWKYGMHPNDEMIQKYIEEGSMYSKR